MKGYLSSLAEPALERAHPSLAVPGSVTLTRAEVEVLAVDVTWIGATVIGKRRDARGRWCLGLRWYASISIGSREGWFLYDARRVWPISDQ